MLQAPPARPGMSEHEVDTPALLIDLDAFEYNLDRMAQRLAGTGVALRAHAKTHKSPIIARLQMARGAVGQCVQKIGEAEVLAWGGVTDILVSNQAVGAGKLARLAALGRIAQVAICVDDARQIDPHDVVGLHQKLREVRRFAALELCRIFGSERGDSGRQQFDKHRSVEQIAKPSVPAILQHDVITGVGQHDELVAVVESGSGDPWRECQLVAAGISQIDHFNAVDVIDQWRRQVERRLLPTKGHRLRPVARLKWCPVHVDGRRAPGPQYEAAPSTKRRPVLTFRQGFSSSVEGSAAPRLVCS